MSLSMFGYHTCSRVRDFIRTIPGIFKYNSDKSAFSCFLVPRRIQPYSIVNSSHCCERSSWSSGQSWKQKIHQAKKDWIGPCSLPKGCSCKWSSFYLYKVNLICLDLDQTRCLSKRCAIECTTIEVV